MTLSDPQRVALSMLVERFRACMLHAASGDAYEQAWASGAGRANTLESLRGRGLVERKPGSVYYRVTLAGLQELER